MQDIYSLLLWIIPGAILMRVLAIRTGGRGTKGTGELDLLVSYVIASVPVHGLVKSIAWLIEKFGIDGFEASAISSKAWFVSISWPSAVAIGWIAAPIWKWLRRRQS